METVLGKYELRAVIASGPRSTVYEGWDTTISRRVAVKKMPLSQAVQVEGWQDLARFRLEAQAAARLQHSNIVGIFDYGETGDFAYIVMEFVEGDTLESGLAKGVRFPISVIGRLMSDILAGLEYCHRRGVVHRDIKPSNIMVSEDGHAKIADFGLARLDDSNLTQIGMIMGTPAFMSPEQFRGESTDWRTDIYSAGVILYVLLTGERPFDGGLATIMHKALNTDPPKPSQLSETVNPSVDAVVARAMAKRPDQRFQSAKEFADTLCARLVGPGDRQKLVDRLSAARLRRSPRAVSQLALVGGAILIGVAGVTAATVYRPWILHRVARSNGEALPRSPPPAAETFAKGVSGGQKSEQPRTSDLAPTTGNVPANPTANAPTEPADVTHELVPNQSPGVPPQEPQPSARELVPNQSPSVPPQEPQSSARELVPNQLPSVPPQEPQPSDRELVPNQSPSVAPQEAQPPSLPPAVVPAISPLAPRIVPSTPSAATLRIPQSVQRGEVKGPGPRIRKPPAPIARASPPSTRPATRAKGPTDHEEASAGGHDNNTGDAPRSVEQEPQPLKAVPFGRYITQDGKRVFVPTN